MELIAQGMNSCDLSPICRHFSMCVFSVLILTHNLERFPEQNCIFSGVEGKQFSCSHMIDHNLCFCGESEVLTNYVRAIMNGLLSKTLYNPMY